MLIEEIKKQKGLKLEKILYRQHTRKKFIWDKDYNNIIEVKKIPYKIWHYNVWFEGMDENQSYNVNKKDFEDMQKSLL